MTGYSTLQDLHFLIKSLNITVLSSMARARRACIVLLLLGVSPNQRRYAPAVDGNTRTPYRCVVAC